MHVLHSLAVYLHVKSKKNIFHACTSFLSNVYAWKLKESKFMHVLQLQKIFFVQSLQRKMRKNKLVCLKEKFFFHLNEILMKY